MLRRLRGLFRWTGNGKHRLDYPTTYKGMYDLLYGPKDKSVVGLLDEMHAVGEILDQQEHELVQAREELEVYRNLVSSEISQTYAFSIGMMFERQRVVDHLLEKKILVTAKDGTLCSPSRVVPEPVVLEELDR